MEEEKINSCKNCDGQGFILCQECFGSTEFGMIGHCSQCKDAGVEDCPICKNPEEFK